MKILHVSLGLPPLRTGGLTVYCAELMKAQIREGDEVSLLYPGRFLRGQIRIRSSVWEEITTYEIVNPLPIALTFGVSDPAKFIVPCANAAAYQRLLDDLRPDVIHVHSFMGVHQEFFIAAKEMGIAMIFTAHDYYPICLRCTFINAKGECCIEGPSPEACARCNISGGMSLKKSLIMQSAAYARVKDTALGRSIRACVKNVMARRSPTLSGGDQPVEESRAANYESILEYNREIFELFDMVLCVSARAAAVYKEAFPFRDYYVLPITHARLKRHPPRPAYSVLEGRAFRLGYFGGKRAYKGFDVLIAAAKRLISAGYEFELHLYGDDYRGLPSEIRAISHGRIEPENTAAALRCLDAVVVPSTYKETFGFVVLEALCEGVPVICSDAVGSRDLVDPRMVFRSGDGDDLAERVARLMGGEHIEVTVPASYPLSMSDQASRLTDIYKRVQMGGEDG